MWKFITNIAFKDEEKKSFSSFVKIVLVMLIAIITFSQIRTFVGRVNDKGIVAYVTSYFGGSIESFDLFLRKPLEKSDIIGKETFYGLNNTLAKLNIIEHYRTHLEFRSSNGVVIGNVYTAFRSFYYDFGVEGIVILQIILAIFWTEFYKKMRKENNYLRFNSGLIFYAMFINGLFFHSYRDNFFSSTISVSTITMIIYFVIIKKICVKEERKEEIQ